MQVASEAVPLQEGGGLVTRIRALLLAVAPVMCATSLLACALATAGAALAQAPAAPARPPAPTRPVAPPPAKPAPGTPAPGTTTPNIRLVGVILKEGQASIALIETPQQRQGLYRVGDTVGEARIEQIHEDRAVVSFRGEHVVLRLTTSPSAAPPGPVPPPAASRPAEPDANARLRDLARRLRDNPNDAEASAEMRRLRGEQRAAPVSARDLSQASAASDVASAQPVEDGVRVTEVNEEGLLARLGLRPGDIVRRVNERPVGPGHSLGEALAEAAMGSDSVQIELTRGGAQTRQEHRLVP